MTRIILLENIDAMHAIEQLQREVWPGDDIEVVPAHLLITAVQNGGLLLGAYADELTTPRPGEPPRAARPPDENPAAQDIPPEGAPPEGAPPERPSPEGAPPDGGRLVGFVFGFPGIYQTPDGPRVKHCSHMLGVLPAYRSQGIGFDLKRAQWQMARNQGLDRITWTYDPLLSKNAHLNIARLGAVCSTYLRDEYGPLRDGLNVGLPTDRLQVDWWVNSPRVLQRLGTRPRKRLDLAHYLAGGVGIINPARLTAAGWPQPPDFSAAETLAQAEAIGPQRPLLLMEIPADFQSLRHADVSLAVDWRLHVRQLCEALFAAGYIITDFIHLAGEKPRSFYAFSHGEAEIGAFTKI